jgi:hypothetical protein
METEGPQTEQETKEGGPKSNVVRLPRDWLGPRDELVPFGTGASDAGEPDLAEDKPGADAPKSRRSRGKIEASERDRPRLRGLDDGAAPPEGAVAPAGGLVSAPSASDFWSEHSEVIHDVLQGPTPASIETQRGDAGGPPEQPPASPIPSVVPTVPSLRRRRWPKKPAGRWRRWKYIVDSPSAGVGGQSASDRESPAASDVAQRSRRRPKARTMRIAVGAVGVGAVVVAVVTSSTGSVHAPRALNSASQANGSVKATGLQLRFDRLLATIGEGGPTRRVASAHRSQAMRRRPPARRTAKLAKTNPAPSRPAPSYVAPTQSAPSYSLPASTYNSPASRSSSSSGSAPGSGSSSGGGGTGSSAPAGPVGQGAPFGPGHLG